MNVSKECEQNIVMVSKGVPGAVRVLCEVVSVFGEKAIEGFIAAGIYGSDVWIAYKDFADGNLEVMYEAVLKCNPELMGVIQQNR